jgi:hypothetical protein
MIALGRALGYQRSAPVKLDLSSDDMRLAAGFMAAANAKFFFWRGLHDLTSETVAADEKKRQPLCPFDSSGRNSCALLGLVAPFCKALGLFSVRHTICCPDCLSQIPVVRWHDRLEISILHLFEGQIDPVVACSMSSLIVHVFERSLYACRVCPDWQGESWRSCSSCSHVFVACPEDVQISVDLVTLSRHFWVTLPGLMFSYRVVTPLLAVDLVLGGHCRYLDCIMLWIRGNHYACIQWVVRSAANPVETGWYYYDGMVGYNRATRRQRPVSNALFLGRDTFGKHHDNLRLNELQVLVYSEYPDVNTRPCLKTSCKLLPPPRNSESVLFRHRRADQICLE